MNIWKHSILAAATLLLAACTTNSNDEGLLRMLVGTYTDGNDSRGAYLLTFNQEDASWALLDTAKAGNPSFIIPSEDRTRAWSVGEFEDGRQGAYSYSLSDSNLDVLNFQSTDGEASGASPCNIIAAGGSVFTSNYGGGTVSAFPIAADGTLDPLSSQYVPAGEAPSHIHCAALSPDGKYLFVTDLGLDAIYRFTIGQPSEPLQDAVVAYQFDRDVHPGPRHLIFSRDGRFAYLINEIGDYVTTFSYDGGELGHIATGLAYDGEGHGSADIHLSPDGRFLYTSHRLKEDGIAIFKVDAENGTLERAGYCPTGKHPRNFAITPNGKYLLCACRDSGAIEIYDIDSSDGSLSYTGKSIEIPAPVCIQLY